VLALNEKNQEVLEAHIKMIDKEPKKLNFGILKELTAAAAEAAADEEATSAAAAAEEGDKKVVDKQAATTTTSATSNAEQLIDYERDFDEFMSSSNLLLPSQLLMDESLFANATAAMDSSGLDLLGSLNQSSNNHSSSELLGATSKGTPTSQLNKNPSKKANDVSKWFQLFSELDPLNQQHEQIDAANNLHAA